MVDLSINNYNNRGISPNFRAKMLMQGPIGNKKFWTSVADEFERITVKAPNDSYLLRYDGNDLALTFSNMGDSSMTVHFSELFRARELKKLGSQKVAEMLSSVADLLNENSVLLGEFQKLIRKSNRKSSDIDGVTLDIAYGVMASRQRNNLIKYAEKNELIKKYVRFSNQT